MTAKSIIFWVVAFLLCILVATKVLQRPMPLEMGIVRFLEIAQENYDPKARKNDAFKDIVDRSGKIEGSILVTAAEAKLGKSTNLTQLAAAAKQVGNDQYVPFTTSYVPGQAAEILRVMKDAGVHQYNGKEPSGLFLQLMLTILAPIVLIAVLWLLFVRQLQNSGNKAMSFGKSRAKMVTDGQVKVTFDDVAGVDEAKEELKEIVEFLKDPKKFSRLGAKIPKGVLLFGPPGTGKTLLAKAIAGEAGVPFFSISGSDFVEMFVGVGASRVRDLFDQAKKNKPCLIFIDEIDAVGRHRFAGIGGGHDEREQTLNQLLVEMDGFQGNEGVILVAATNRPDVLDPALLRPGRFDRQVTVDYPDVVGRERILKVHAKNVKLMPNVDLKPIAQGTTGFSGADLANIVNEAALLAARKNRSAVEQPDLEEAKDRVMMGPERRSMQISPKEKRATAVHEAGHALAAHFTEGCDPVHKITVIPRGRSLGLTAVLPGEDKHNYWRSQLKAQLVYGLGGMAAEQEVYGETGTGVSNDLQRVTSTARTMVCRVGMSDRLGPRAFGEGNSNVFLGRDLGNQEKNYSEEMARIIDEEVKSIVDEAYNRARTIMREKRALLDALTEALIDRETLNGDDFVKLMNGEPLPPLFNKDSPMGPPPPAADAKPEEERKPRAPRLGDILDGPRPAAG